jgi:hypothetical protein
MALVADAPMLLISCDVTSDIDEDALSINASLHGLNKLMLFKTATGFCVIKLQFFRLPVYSKGMLTKIAYALPVLKYYTAYTIYKHISKSVRVRYAVASLLHIATPN